MRHLGTCLAAVAVAMHAVSAMADDQEAKPRTASNVHYDEAIAKLEAAVRYEVEQKQLPALSISLVDRDRAVWADGFGFQDADKKVPATAETIYRVGSVSKLHASSFVVTPAVEEKLATGWMWTYDGRRFEAPKFLLGTGPAGNLYSSVLDLSKFLKCLFEDGQTGGGEILQPETLALMTTPINDVDGNGLVRAVLPESDWNMCKRTIEVPQELGRSSLSPRQIPGWR